MARPLDPLTVDGHLVGRALCEARSDQTDAFLAQLFDDADAPSSGVALVALGGYGRRELSLQSDLDVLLLHDVRVDIGAMADAIWYPIWDAGLRLGHAVRTLTDAVDLAGEDLDSATSMLQARHLVGDQKLTTQLIDTMVDLWTGRAKRFLPQLATRVRERHDHAGEVAFLLEPDLKEGRGGLRDVQSLQWAHRARPAFWDGDTTTLHSAYEVLLEARVELHRRTGRPGDVLALQEQDAVAAALGDADADALMQRVADAARTIAFRSDDAWRRIERDLKSPRRIFGRRERELGAGVSVRDDEVCLDGVEHPTATDALRVAALAAAENLPIHRATLDLLGDIEPIADPWPTEARTHFVDLLLAGRSAIGRIESLDQCGALVRILPEWDSLRSRPQRNAYHRFTVDRHLCEAAANAAALVGRVPRPDLLVIGTLLHDVGKGFPGDHTEVGMKLVRDIGTRMGFGDEDVETLVFLVEHHLLLPDVATRRDLDDPEVIERIAGVVGSLGRIELLHALTEADSIATGPAAWGRWKEELVETLVRRVEHIFGGGEAQEITDDFPSASQLEIVRSGEQIVSARHDTLTVVAADRPGLFSRVTGALALHGIGVRDANIATIDGRALEVFTVESSFGSTISWAEVIADIERAIAGRLAIRARLSMRADTYRRTKPVAAPQQPRVEFHLDDSSHATVVEVHAPDSVGVLSRITGAIADMDLDIVRARVQTLLDEVVDAFYLQDQRGGKVDDEVLAELRLAILHAIE